MVIQNGSSNANMPTLSMGQKLKMFRDINNMSQEQLEQALKALY